MVRKRCDVESFPKLRSKKGLSGVVTTVLLILIAIVAIAIVWVVVRNLINNASGGISINGFSLDLSIKKAYIDGTDVKVDVQRNAGAGNLTGIYFIFHNGTSSSSVQRNIALKELEEQTFTFNSTEVGDITGLELVSVSPIYQSGGKDVIGSITDTQEITNGAASGGNQGNQSGNNNSNESQGGGGSICGNNICEASETAQSCPADCTAAPSCNGIWEGASEDPNVECDGGNRCDALCSCEQGYSGDGSGGCTPDPAVNAGIVDSTWPSGAVKYFDSENLPKDSVTIISYIGKYASFTGAETRCLQISYAEYLSDPAYNKSYLRLELPSSVENGDAYQVWTSKTCGAP